MNSNLSYPIITQHCNDLAIGAESSLLVDAGLQTGVKFSYPGFNFVAGADNADIEMDLKCTVSFNLRISYLNKQFQISKEKLFIFN